MEPDRGYGEYLQTKRQLAFSGVCRFLDLLAWVAHRWASGVSAPIGGLFRRGRTTQPRVFSPIGVWISPDYSEGTNSEVADTIFEKQVGIMFKNSCDEEKLCQVLKAYVEEWGPENVIVSVPRHWSEYSTSSLGRVRLEFATRDTVSIRVEYDFVRLNYDVQLQAA